MVEFIQPSEIRRIRQAAEVSIYTGMGTPKDQFIVSACTHAHFRTGTVVIFTRDGHFHDSGWIKNPDFNQCYHLSLSFFDRATGESAPQNRKKADLWCKLLFGQDNLRKLLIEGPKSPEGNIKDVWHYRLFTDHYWQPLVPRGEPYNKVRTETGWQTWSEIHGRNTEPVIFPADAR